MPPKSKQAATAAGPMACNICSHHPLEADGSCGKCGADPETAWTPPVNWAAPISDDELRLLRNTTPRFTDEEVWTMRRKFRSSGMTSMSAFLKKEGISYDAGMNALRGRKGYKDV